MKTYANLGELVNDDCICYYCNAMLNCKLIQSFPTVIANLSESKFTNNAFAGVFSFTQDNTVYAYNMQISMDNKLSFKPVHNARWNQAVGTETIASYFNLTKLKVLHICHNPLCNQRYYKKSNPLDIHKISNTKYKIMTPTSHEQGIVLDGLKVTCLPENKEMLIESLNSPKSISTKKLELNRETAQDFINRVRVVAVFS